MRVGLAVSSVGHAMLIAFGMIGLSGTSSYESLQQESLPIDVISMAEYTQVTEGVHDGEADIEPQAPEVEEEEVADVDQPTPEPRRVDEVREAPDLEPVEEAAAPEPDARPEPEPEPVAIPQPEAEPQPEPEAQGEPEPRPMLSNAPTPPKRPDSPEPEPEQSPEPEPRSDPIADLAAEPEPEPDAPAQRESEFSADRISALLNRAPESGGAVDSEMPGETHSLGLQTGSDDTLSISDIDALRRQIARCWNPPVGLQDAGRLVVRLGLELNRDGSLAGAPRILNDGRDAMFTVAAEAAQRAVHRCQPYDLPPEKYDVWQEIHVNFDPRELLGG